MKSSKKNLISPQSVSFKDIIEIDKRSEEKNQLQYLTQKKNPISSKILNFQSNIDSYEYKTKTEEQKYFPKTERKNNSSKSKFLQSFTPNVKTSKFKIEVSSSTLFQNNKTDSIHSENQFAPSKEIIYKKTIADVVKDKNEEHKLDENAVKRLELWDLRNIKQVKTGIVEDNHLLRRDNKKNSICTMVTNFVESNPNSQIANVDMIQSMAYRKKFQENMTKINNKMFLPFMKELHKRIDQEQGAILLQNINLTKRCFKFDEMNKKKNLNIYSPEKDKEVIENKFMQVGNKVALRRKEDENQGKIDEDNSNLDHLNVKVDDPFLRCHNLKLEGNYDMLTSTDFYRKTVTDKIRIETLFRKEMMRLSRLISSKNLEKENILKKNAELIKTLAIKRDSLTAQQDVFELFKKELENNRISKLKNNKSIFSNEGFGMNSNNTSHHQVNSQDFNFDLNSKYYNLLNIRQTEIDNLKNEYEDLSNKFKKFTCLNNENIQKIDDEIRESKILLSDIMKEQTNYFFDLLAKGIDVRSEGLCWIIRRLLELNAYIDNHNFPKFLEPYQIQYLISISKKQISSIQLKILLKIMKNKQSKLREEKDIFRISSMTGTSKDTSLLNDFNKENSLSPKTNKYFNIDDSNNDKVQTQFGVSFPNSSHHTSSNKLTKIMDGIFTKNDTMMKISYEKSIEDKHINNIILELKKKLRMDFPYEDENFYHHFPVSFTEEIDANIKQTTHRTIHQKTDYFKENMDEKKLFEDIMLVRDNLKILQDDLSHMIETQKNYFRIRYESLRKGTARQAINYDLMYAALFGNHVVL